MGGCWFLFNYTKLKEIKMEISVFVVREYQGITEVFSSLEKAVKGIENFKRNDTVYGIDFTIIKHQLNPEVPYDGMSFKDVWRYSTDDKRLTEGWGEGLEVHFPEPPIDKVLKKENWATQDDKYYTVLLKEKENKFKITIDVYDRGLDPGPLMYHVKDLETDNVDVSVFQFDIIVGELKELNNVWKINDVLNKHQG
jgi:hypothetical protein